MHGNVWEWCEDRYATDAYKGPDGPDPVVSCNSHEGCDPTTALRVFRGGSFDYPAEECRSADRELNFPPATCFDIGFRVVRPLP